ncbi:MAG: hypothetical protein NVSMB25_25770 [Thermoleophilaceae bacterium]
MSERDSEQLVLASSSHHPAKRVQTPPSALEDGSARPWAAPLAFDASGYPVKQSIPSFDERVRRLLSAR